MSSPESILCWFAEPWVPIGELAFRGFRSGMLGHGLLSGNRHDDASATGRAFNKQWPLTNLLHPVKQSLDLVRRCRTVPAIGKKRQLYLLDLIGDINPKWS